MVCVCPAMSVPSAQGNAVVQAPLFETNASPALGVSVTTVLVASAGPKFFTWIVYVTFWPGTAEVVPDLLIFRSACSPTFVVTVDESFVLFGSVPGAAWAAPAVFVTLPEKFGDVL